MTTISSATRTLNAGKKTIITSQDGSTVTTITATLSSYETLTGIDVTSPGTWHGGDVLQPGTISGLGPSYHESLANLAESGSISGATIEAIEPLPDALQRLGGKLDVAGQFGGVILDILDGTAHQDISTAEDIATGITSASIGTVAGTGVSAVVVTAGAPAAAGFATAGVIGTIVAPEIKDGLDDLAAQEVVKLRDGQAYVDQFTGQCQSKINLLYPLPFRIICRCRLSVLSSTLTAVQKSSV